MAAEAPKQEFLIKDLPTKSVTLYPSRAHIVRDIDNVVLQPGSNEIVIYGLTPTADEHSVQVDGRGAATVTDMIVELVPNRETFEEVYTEDSDDSDSEYEDSDDDVDTVKEISEQLGELKLKHSEAVESQLSADRRLESLDQYSKSIKAEKNSPGDMSKLLEMYENERASIYKSHAAATESLKKLNKQIARKEHEKQVAGKDETKRKEKLAKKKSLEHKRKERQKAEKKREAGMFFPSKVYKVTLVIEAAIDTPGSSRRGSVDSLTLAHGDVPSSNPEKYNGGPSTTERSVSLSLSYVTSEASWSPRYDISISSSTKTATIVYRAEFKNATSESWQDCKVALSTSQTSFSGLEDKIPFMHAWHVRLGRHYDSGSGGLLSMEETQKPRYGNAISSNVNRSDLFAYSKEKAQSANIQKMALSAPQQQMQQQQVFGGHPQQQQQRSGALYQSNHFPGGFGGSSNVVAAARGAPAKSKKKVSGIFDRNQADTDSFQEEELSLDLDGAVADNDQLEFEESQWEDQGLTATFSVPGTRTLVPSSTARRHRIATLHAQKIYMSYIAVPKLRSAAFLRAKIRNPSSSVTLLKGTAGVTLDGSFLGNMPLPRVSPAQVFDLSLGVDAAVHISYPKPTVRRSTQGIFSKESAEVFSRSVWLTNTKSTPIELLVLDQVPVSQEERLRVDLLQPKGLLKEGDTVRTGLSAKEGSSGATSVTQGTAWGKATATLKKEGEIAWTVNLEKGQACLLKLEYEARMPSAERIVTA